MSKQYFVGPETMNQTVHTISMWISFTPDYIEVRWSVKSCAIDLSEADSRFKSRPKAQQLNMEWLKESKVAKMSKACLFVRQVRLWEDI
jgi:hypothetical protein